MIPTTKMKNRQSFFTAESLVYRREWVYPKITVNLKFLLFYPNPKGDKRNFKLVSVQKGDTLTRILLFKVDDTHVFIETKNSVDIIKTINVFM
jgi:hypothetical protein